MQADRAAIEAKYREQIDDARAELAAKVRPVCLATPPYQNSDHAVHDRQERVSAI